MKNIVITGASSFIGRKLCQYFQEHGENVYAVARRNADLCEPIVQITADMSQYEQLDIMLPKNMDVGILLAWEGTRGAGRNDASLQQNNVKRSIACLKALHRCGCKTIVFAGSQAQYGPQTNDLPTKESDEPHPNTEYGKAKLAFGRYAAEYCYENSLRYLEPRIFSIYGEGDFEGTLTMSLLKKMKSDVPCELTQCIQLWDYIYVNDAVKIMAMLIETATANGIYNIASGDVRPLKEFVVQMHEITGSKSELLFGAVAYPSTGIVNINPSVEKLKNTIGAIALTPFDVGIRSMLKEIDVLIQ